ncbi:MAG: hypothetical protein F6K40_11115 [Okeania sp. SIO3I5]|uniref:DUF6492 family protein n=1 Tax=Okeania sp. SIO3I5 TaxID=2607805 RepID=UPI0013BB94B3|nr:DUF6492 family protein [Okeania sp. SIO3I5]NEQ36797.1 hypothetical protein [Okeania sp. SIO3I5]
MSQRIDIVIPVAAKDIPKLKICITSIIANSLTPIQNIYIVTNQDIIKKNLYFDERVIWINESEYPFTLKDIEMTFKKKSTQYQNSSWYYQQLLKFYIFQTIPNLQQNTLILDVDFFIGQNINFLTDDGKAILSYGYPFKWLLNTRQYPSQNQHSHIEFAQRLIPNWQPINSFSGMHHHILFQKEIIEKLFSIIEDNHQQEFWQAFIDNIEFKKWNAASEYVIYYHFAMKFYPDSVISRHLKGCDFIHDEKENHFVLEMAKNTLDRGEFQVVGCHSFLDLRERLKTMDYIPTDLKQKMLDSERIVFKLILDDSLLRIETF